MLISPSKSETLSTLILSGLTVLFELIIVWEFSLTAKIVFLSFLISGSAFLIITTGSSSFLGGI